MMYKCTACGNTEESVEAVANCSKCGGESTMQPSAEGHDESSTPMAGGSEGQDNM
ncbi:MAG: hypothetical protein UW43_C0002G0043 [Candidatus Yanofskybacteria bacterium GW2011_GWA1_44_21]|uniref:Uncharacterized protein n=1 Tax=Candidatus Wolfebacteria bacterium GW2011_GWB1_41_12 TaxID=1619006 RepID=A0A0G0UIR6_9BACT|nr:MAG: hypothetical protein UU38_C0004G0046 [Candidatus Wolfebacteria bacterium GW2011_GWB1_41_12]KKT28936.1 MAG: hypothetical protein UW14_C0001G0047 [Candidatus Yanofskybacteria bacterium GW2011_GWA2_44_10]KKT50759.1 MAG: hypothetical protein UW43_C0002G0043 [Candidatus Yanofskybacteria bacterium GW2011_GWA1_44_21]